MCVFEFGKICFPGLALAEKQDRRFRKGPASVHGADLFAHRPQAVAMGFLGALHQTTRGDKILYPRKAGHILDLVEDDQRPDLSDPGHRLQPGERLDIIGVGTAREREFDLTQQLILVIDE
jgi:hypothetical protein